MMTTLAFNFWSRTKASESENHTCSPSWRVRIVSQRLCRPGPVAQWETRFGLVVVAQNDRRGTRRQMGPRKLSRTPEELGVTTDKEDLVQRDTRITGRIRIDCG
jgi:hypothetical protein